MAEVLASGQVRHGFRHAVNRDIEEYARHASEFLEGGLGTLRKISILLTPGLMCTVLHRCAHWLWLRGLERPARAAAALNYLVHKAAINPASDIGPGLYVPHTVGIVFCGRAGERLTLYTAAVVTPRVPSLRWQELDAGCPELGEGVTVGAYAMALGPVQIGNGARLGPGAVVTDSVKAGATVISADHVGLRHMRNAMQEDE